MSLATSPAAAVAAAGRELVPLGDRLWAAATDDALVDGLAAVQGLKAHLAAVEAAMLAEVDVREVPRKQLHWASTADWFTHLAGLTQREGRRATRHARQLVGERTATLDALRAGRCSPAQASVVCDAVADLPGDPALRQRGELELLSHTGTLHATDLARAGRHLAEVVDPERADRKAESALARDERSAHLERYLSIVDDGAGGVRVRGRGSVEDGAALRAALLPLTKPDPRPDDPALDADPRDHGARLWDAFIEVAQHALDTDRVPTSHGARPRVSVLIDWAALADEATATGATTDDGLDLSHAAVRRLACDADIIPVCLGTDGEVLDVGRAHRLVTAALWRALIARDRHCTFPGCTRPPVMGHAHHIVPWARGGGTSLDNLVLVCGRHHRVLHDTPWRVRLHHRDGQPEYLPPPRPGEPPGTAWVRHRSRSQAPPPD